MLSPAEPCSPPLPRLQTGWSVHTFQTEKQRKMQALSPKELEVILGVIHKAEKLDVVEQQRIGYVPCPLPSPGKASTGRRGSPSCLSSASSTQSIPEVSYLPLPRCLFGDDDHGGGCHDFLLSEGFL